MSAKNFFKRIGLIPEYSELDLFLISVVFLLLLFIDPEARKFLFFYRTHEIDYILFYLIFFSGVGLSIYHIFIRKKRLNLKKS